MCELLVLLVVADASADRWTGQMMLIAGIALMIWVLFRRQLKLRAAGRATDRESATQRRRWENQVNSGAPLADAPASVAKWQAGMFDLQRELKAELDAKISVLQAMVKLADERIAKLSRFETVASDRHATIDRHSSGQQSAAGLEPTGQSPAADMADLSESVQRLTRDGYTAEEIARRLNVSLGDVEFLQGLS